MKKIIYLFLIVFVMMNSSCQNEEISQSNINQELTDYILSEIKDDIVFNGEYLEFKSQEVFDSILSDLRKFDDNEFQNWEKGLGFESAKTLMSQFKQSLSTVTNETEAELLIENNKHKFNINKEFSLVKYRFYARSLDRVLNIDGLVKIGKSLYKFTEDTEYIGYDGKIDRIEDAINNGKLKSKKKSTDELLLIISNADNLKSSTIIVDEGVVTVDIRRLIYSIEKFVFSTFYAVDIYNGGYITQYGYQLSLTMNQEKWYWLPFKYDWRNNEASYYVRDVYIDWNQIGDSSIGYEGSLPNADYATTRSEVTYTFLSRHYFVHDMYLNADFSYSLDATFWSSGIGESNNITVNL